MPTIDAQLILFVLGVGVLTAIAAVMDIRTRRIPNKLTLPIFVLGIVYQIVFNGWAGLADAGIAFAVGFGTLFLLWMIGGGGGGDVKLMGALSVWLGYRTTLLVLIVSTIFVALGTVGVMAWSMMTRGGNRTKEQFTKKSKRADGVETVAERQQRRVMAYAVPVALATWVVVIWRLTQT